jgi:hypothetical protein
MEGTVPQFGGGSRSRGRVWRPAKVLRSRSNLFAGTETLSLSVNEPIAKQILVGGTVPKFGGGVELGGRVGSGPKETNVVISRNPCLSAIGSL